MGAPLRVGIVVGEASGDLLGAGLMRALKQRHPDIVFEGMGGSRMIAEGMESMFAMDRLSVMGLIDPLKRLPELLHIRKTLKKHFLKSRPDVFVGIDSPDFNLGLALSLKTAGIKTVHYVSPSVWAWRQKRVFKIKRAVDMMLCLLPFEAAFYERFNVPVRFVGHPLASQLKPQPVRDFGVAPQIALMPGSRRNEVALMADIYVDTAALLLQKLPAARFIMPAASDQRYRELSQKLAGWWRQYPELESRLVLTRDDSHTVMAESDFVICTSGTTSLEAMLLAKPMVIAYRMHWLSYKIIRPMVKAAFIGLPNLLAGKEIVTELEQHEVSADALVAASMRFLADKAHYLETVGMFQSLHRQLDCSASELAAGTILDLAR